MDQKYILRRLAELRLSHLPPVILDWIFQDLKGLDEASVQAILTLDYAVLATCRAIEELARVGVPSGPGARQQWVAADGSGRVLETVTITRRAVRDMQRRPRRYIGQQMEFGFVASLKRPRRARPSEGDQSGRFFTSQGGADNCTR